MNKIFLYKTKIIWHGKAIKKYLEKSVMYINRKINLSIISRLKESNILCSTSFFIKD